MIEHASLHHHIQKHIVRVLMYKDRARFSELRPSGVDTNLFTYHLKQLIKEGYLKKVDTLYTLSSFGLSYVDRISSETGSIRRQPKIISMLVVQNSDGQVLLQKRTKQPYIDCWTLPYGKTHIDDDSILVGASREVGEKPGLSDQVLRHVGDGYIRVYGGGAILSSTLVHVFRFETDDISEDDSTMWVEPLKLSALRLAPAVEAIVTRCFFGDDHFFAEFDCIWND